MVFFPYHFCLPMIVYNCFGIFMNEDYINFPNINFVLDF